MQPCTCGGEPLRPGAAAAACDLVAKSHAVQRGAHNYCAHQQSQRGDGRRPRPPTPAPGQAPVRPNPPYCYLPLGQSASSAGPCPRPPARPVPPAGLGSACAWRSPGGLCRGKGAESEKSNGKHVVDGRARRAQHGTAQQATERAATTAARSRDSWDGGQPRRHGSPRTHDECRGRPVPLRLTTPAACWPKWPDPA